MAPFNANNFQAILQTAIRPDDHEWVYFVPDLPSSTTIVGNSLIKSISVTSNENLQSMKLRLEKHSPNRGVEDANLDRYMTISFKNFRLQCPSTECEEGAKTKPSPPKDSADYVIRLLRSGIILNNTHYQFYAHSNSQLKSGTCVLFAGSLTEISQRIERLGKFTEIKSVPKLAKRIGLLFSSAKVATQLQTDRSEDIPDEIRGDYNFTDGCGLIAAHFAKILVQKLNICFRNQRYLPTVYQIRYRGYKGVLTLDPNLRGKTLVQFRDSMKKIHGGDDLSFCVVEYSKPYTFGFLNDEVVLLLHTLGISSSTLLRKQTEHLELLAAATRDPPAAFQFLSYINEPVLAESVLMEGIESVQNSVRKLVNGEFSKMLNKRDEQRCRILVRKSRLLFGICDPRNKLRNGECALRLTMVEDGVPKSIVGTEVLVTRNPCLHPGDLQKFKAVQYEELSHLVDCIVFPTQGQRPSADMMSGGDLDGDKFLVCWDPDLIPARLAEPASYIGDPEPTVFRKISYDDRLVYFAQYTNAALGRIKNLYLDWARLHGPLSSQCQELNYLFSHCVDGSQIKIPKHLINPPPVDLADPKFVLDVLHDNVKNDVLRTWQPSSYDTLSHEGLDLILSRDSAAFSEFETLKMTAKWCLRNNSCLQDHLDFFNFDQMSDEERAWVVAQMPHSQTVSGLVMNSLLRSNFLSQEELQHVGLDTPGMRWKKVFDSTTDRLERFMDVAGKVLEQFHRSFVVINISERLSIAMYVPRRLEKYKDNVVHDAVRLFSFSHSQGNETVYRLAVPTKTNYRLYFDDTGFQLYGKQRRDTWIFFTRPGSDDASYKAARTQGERRRERQVTVERGLNSDFVISIALEKFSRGLAEHIGGVNRNPVLGAEIYVISNRDVRALQVLDQWLQYVDTQEVMPLFENIGRAHKAASTKDLDWSTVAEPLRLITRDENFSIFYTFEDDEAIVEVFEWLLLHEQKKTLRKAFEYLLSAITTSRSPRLRTTAIDAMLTYLQRAPFLVVVFSGTCRWDHLQISDRTIFEDRAVDLLKACALAASQMQVLVVEPFRQVLSQMSHLSLQSFGDLVELISVVVRSPETALDLMIGCLEPHSSRLLTASPRILQYFVHHYICVAVQHIEETNESRSTREDLLDLMPGTAPDVVESRVRIDSQSLAKLSTNDHVQFTATLASDSVGSIAYSMDALIEKSEPSLITARCFHPIPYFLENCSWSVSYCGSYVTTKTMFQALRFFVMEPQRACPVFERIIGIDVTVELDDSYARKTNPGAGKLNKSQRDAVVAVCESPMTCLWGPPGTGKTYTIAVILEMLSLDPKRRILVTAPTHSAVDNIMRKYLDNVGTQERAATLILRVSTDVRKVDEELRKYTCDAMMGKDLNENPAGRRKAQKRIKECRMVFTTCIGAGLGLLRSEKFNTVIIDEASQQTEPQSLVPLTKGCTKAVLVGDHEQLSATVLPLAQAMEFDISLFERLQKSPDGSDRVCKLMLDTQYRMHASICAFSSNEFYEGRLKTAVSDSSRPLRPSTFPWPSPQDGKLARIFFIQCTTPEDIGRKFKTNRGQVTVAGTICKMLMRQDEGTDNAQPPSVAALSPYKRQVETLRATLPRGVLVSSIDGFQGREADVILFVTTRCNSSGDIGFLKDMRRLNVVLTRAKAACIIIGDRGTLGRESSADEPWSGVWKRLLGCSTTLILE